MAPEQRKAMQCPTQMEGDAKCARVEERKMHHMFEAWLLRNDIMYRHDRMDRKTTCAKGWPDFQMLYNGLTCFVEFKVPGNTLEPEQEAIGLKLMQNGFSCLVAFTYESAVRWTEEQLGMI